MRSLKLVGLLVLVLILSSCRVSNEEEGTPESHVVSETYAQATENYVQKSTPNATAAELTNTPIPATQIPSPTPTRVSEYTVQGGDTLSGIAEMFGTSVDLLAITNEDIEYIDLIFPDQVIQLPDPSEIPEPVSQDGKEIVIKTSTQQLFAFEDGVLVRSFIVSTGLPDTPTLVDNYNIYSKYKVSPMSGPGYYYPKVPWVMYYSSKYGIHGTTWHSNFGQPMSHGCTNMSVEHAKWLFEWTPDKTPVTVVTR